MERAGSGRIQPTKARLSGRCRTRRDEDRVDCKDVIAQLSDYLDAEAAQDLCLSLEAHFVKCSHCRVYIDTVKKTISLYRSESALECPEQVRLRLHTILSFEYRKK